MKKIIGLTNSFIKSLISLSILLILVIICLQVFFRFVLNNPLSWPEEASRFLMVWSLFLSSAYAYLDREHAGITFLSRHFGKNLALISEILIQLIVISFCLVLIYGGWMEMTILKDLKTGALGISRAIPYAAIPTSSLILIAFALRLIVTAFQVRVGK